MSVETMTLYEAEQLFELPQTYTQSDVKEAYRKLILEKHPDVRKDVDAATANKEASEINTAKKLLLNRFKTNPQATFTCQSTKKQTTYSSSPFTYQQPSQTYSPYSSPTSETSWYEQWWQNASPDVDEAPVEETTWEDLANDFWEEYANETADARISQNRSYSMGDIKRDTVSSIVGGVTKSVARFADGILGDEQQSVSVSQEIIAYEEKKRKIDWATGRLAVLGYFIIVALVVFLGVLALSGAEVPMDYGYSMMAASAVYGFAVLNVFIPFITVILRKIPYRILDREYTKLKAQRDDLDI